MNDALLAPDPSAHTLRKDGLRASYQAGPAPSQRAGPRFTIAPDRLRRILACMLDENEFLSPYGIRALSRYHLEHPYVVTAGGQEYRVNYAPADSDSGMFGGNSNWRAGPASWPRSSRSSEAAMPRKSSMRERR
jgi:hypothetical protein